MKQDTEPRLETRPYRATTRRHMRHAFLSGMALMAGLLIGRAAAAETEILSVAGTVEHLPRGTARWTAARVGAPLQFGDRLRTGPASRATLRFADLSVMRLRENTALELLPPADQDKRPLLDFKSGSLHFLSREKPADVQFRTPTAVGAIRGTEFLLTADDAGVTRLAVLEGEVELGNASGEIRVRSGEEAEVKAGAAPTKTALLNASNSMQWVLYYPAVLDPADLPWAAEERAPFAASLAAYGEGDLLAALAALPENAPGTAGKTYRAAVHLAVGKVAPAQELTAESPGARALRRLIAAVQGDAATNVARPGTASEWLAESYVHQAAGDLEGARAAAKAAAEKAPAFGFAWARVAELEWSFGQRARAESAVTRALALSPRLAPALALQGFLAAARNETREASEWFERAIAVDGALAPAWLGKGLSEFRLGKTEAGRKSLQVAAALEPQRSLYRSYAAKSWSATGRDDLAAKELRLARELDPQDPTAPLYSALLHGQRNEINAAVRDLERSLALNDQQRLFRSGLLLDQDRAVRSANLAGIYRDAGMTDLSVREAQKAVAYDYANFSAHLFLAGSYDAVRDPKLFNLRYETPARAEWLVANLLAPVGAGSLSRHISQQDYTRLFERDRLGITSRTEYSDNGDWVQSASQFGHHGRVGYAIDAYYRKENGFRPNNDLEQLQLSAQVKAQLTLADSLFLQVETFTQETGDIIQYHDQRRFVPTLRVEEEQEPNLFLGYHREWHPGAHTLFLASRLDDRLERSAEGIEQAFVKFGNGAGAAPTSLLPRPFDLDFERKFEAWSFEGQQIQQSEAHTWILGARYQIGWADTDARVRQVPPGPGLQFPPIGTGGETEMDRQAIYLYHQWQVLEPLRLTAGASYDRLHLPENVDTAPVSDDERTVSQLSPKAGLVYDVWQGGTLRAMYGQALGGFLHENSVQLEPTQVGGFNQAFRSILPESAAGAVPGSRFEFAAAGLDQKFSTGTYLGAEGQVLASDGRRTVGAVTSDQPFTEPDQPFALRQRLSYEERAVVLTANQLLGDYFSVGAKYRLADADLHARYTNLRPGLPNFSQVRLRRDESALLQQVNLFVVFNHNSGLFSEWHSVWHHQNNDGSTPSLGGENFWQHHAFLGYRFPRRHVELRVGVLNLTDEDYRLNPLNLYAELPRERTYTVSAKVNF